MISTLVCLNLSQMEMEKNWNLLSSTHFFSCFVDCLSKLFILFIFANLKSRLILGNDDDEQLFKWMSATNHANKNWRESESDWNFWDSVVILLRWGFQLKCCSPPFSQSFYSQSKLVNGARSLTAITSTSTSTSTRMR